MQKTIPPNDWPSQRRFFAHTAVLRRLFGGRVQKLTVDAGFSCPNRDGTLGTLGCSYCDNDAFNPSYCRPEKPLHEQIVEGMAFHTRRYRRAESYLVYFQAYTNTHGPVTLLRQRFEEALRFPSVKGLVIGTRPDCLGDEVISLLHELSGKTWISVELGVESLYDRSLALTGRGHDAASARDAILRLAAAGLHTGIHLMLGLPGESREDMLAEAGMISHLPVNSLKLHQLQIVKGTRMESMYLENPEGFKLFSLDEYTDLVIAFLERLAPYISVERLAAEAPPRFLAVNPFGLMRYDSILRHIEDRMEALNTWQGRLFESQNE